MDPSDVAECKKWAEFYRMRGFNPLPSCVDAKKPMVRFVQYWEKPFPAEVFDRFCTTNLQVMTGRRWGLLVIDLDGEGAWERFHGMGRVPRTWITHRQGGSSWHVWFSVAKDHPHPMPKAFLWKGEGEHSAIERIGDRGLIVAPPSFHTVERLRQYKFLSLDSSPRRVPLPAPAPKWVLGMEPIRSRPEWVPADPAVVKRPVRKGVGMRLPDRDVVIAAIDPIRVASAWGVRFRYRPSPNGWAPCHAVDREDRHPSAAIHCKTGVYVDKGSDCPPMSLFDLGVFMGVYHDWKEAVSDLAESCGIHGG